MKLSLERKISLGFGASLAILVLVTIAAWWNVTRFRSTHEWTTHTQDVINRLEQALSGILGMQSSTRGFVLTGDEEVLQPFQAGLVQIDRVLRELQRLTTDNPSQQARLVELTATARASIDIMHGRIAARRGLGFAAAAETPEYLAGQRTVEKFRALIRQMVVAERDLLDDRLNQARRAARFTVSTIVAATLIATAIVTLATIWVSRDLQIRREAEERILSLHADVARRAQQLEAANRELESFSYSVSHDLRAPLRHIDGFTALLARHASSVLDDEARRYLGIVTKSAQRMSTLIDDLLAFSNIARATLRRETVIQNRLVAEVIADGQYDHDGRAISWEIGPLPDVRGDAAMLRQVWTNLIENAAKYSGKSPATRISIGSRDDESAGEHVFYVRDNGVGFDMACADRLFGVFQRLHASTEFEGTGIGLANVRRIVTRHGGRTWAEGRIGSGAVFYFSLPQDPPSVVSPS